jgi:hypothetical protein
LNFLLRFFIKKYQSTVNLCGDETERRYSNSIEYRIDVIFSFTSRTETNTMILNLIRLREKAKIIYYKKNKKKT